MLFFSRFDWTKIKTKKRINCKESQFPLKAKPPKYCYSSQIKVTNPGIRSKTQKTHVESNDKALKFQTQTSERIRFP